MVMKRLLLFLILSFPVFSQTNPLDANTLALWRPDSGITRTATDSVTSWVDRGATAYDAIKFTDALRPYYNETNLLVKFEETWLYIAAANATGLNITGDWSIEIRFKYAATGGVLMAKRWSTATNQAGWLVSQIAGGTCRLYLCDGTNQVQHNITGLTNATWYVAAYTYDASEDTLNAYLDGIWKSGLSSATVTTASITNANNFYFCSSQNGTLSTLSIISDVRISDKVRTASELLNYVSWINNNRQEASAATANFKQYSNYSKFKSW